MKIKTITTIITVTTVTILLPLMGLAQLDFDLNNLFDIETAPDITITNLELIWSSDTYVPYEYTGRALPSPGSKITVEAIVNAIGNTFNLKYSWFLEDIFQRTKSGYGKDSFSFYVNQRGGGYHTIKAQIFNEDRSIFDERTIKIPIVEPEVAIYSSNGSSYFSDQAIKVSTILSDKKFSFITKPYFFSIKKLTDLSFEWRFANQEPIISSAYNANILDLTITEKTDKEISENNLWVNITNKINSRQKVSQMIKVQIY